jgi:hypothetical protein
MVGSTVHSSFGTDNFSTGLSCRILSQDGFTFKTTAGAGELMRITSAGNVGIGTSSIPTTSVSHLKINTNTFLTDNTYTSLTHNAYWNSGWKYNTSNAATLYQIESDHVWYTAASGSAGGAISFSERMRITDSGHVGIGTNSPDVALEVLDDTTWDMTHFTGGSTVGAGFTMNATDTGVSWSLIAQGTTGGGNDNNLGFHLTNAGTSGQSTGYKFVMTPAGNLGIGTTSPAEKLAVNGNLRLQSGTNPTRIQYFNSTGAYTLNSSGGASISFHDVSGSQEISFETHYAGNSHDERMRITKEGHLLLNTQSHNFATTQPIQEIYTPGASNGGLSIRSQQSSSQAYHALGLWTGANGSTSTGYPISFYHGSSGINEGTITVTSAGVTYNTTSDYRLKENIEIIADAKERLLALKPVRHSWKDAPETTVDGFIAHEVQEAGFEYAVTGEKDAEDMQSMDYGRITPVIVAALQDALKEIDMLKDRITELEAK